MTHPLKPHDLYFKLDSYVDDLKYSPLPSSDEENEYFDLLLTKWDKWRFTENPEKALASLRVIAENSASYPELGTRVIELIDEHVEESITGLFEGHQAHIRSVVGLPEKVEETPEEAPAK